MKHLKIVLLAFTLVFSVAAIAAPKNDKTPKAPKAHKTHKATKADNTKKPAFACYYFEITNDVTQTTPCGSASFTLSFSTTPPSTTPPSTCTGDPVYYCAFGFPNYVLDGGVYKPSLNGVTVLPPSSYCSNACDITYRELTHH